MNRMLSTVRLERDGLDVRLSFPNARGFHLRTSPAFVVRSGFLGYGQQNAKSLDDSIGQWRALWSRLRGDGFEPVLVPHIYEREHNGQRQAALVDWPRRSTVRWAIVPWDIDPWDIPWRVVERASAVDALRGFRLRCESAKTAGFVPWRPRWPDAFAALVGPDSGLVEHSEGAPGHETRRFFSGPGHDETGPELHRHPDETWNVHVQIDGQVIGSQLYFDDQGLILARTLDAGVLTGHSNVLSKDDHSTITLASMSDGGKVRWNRRLLAEGDTWQSGVHCDWLPAMLDAPPSLAAFRRLCRGILDFAEGELEAARSLVTRALAVVSSWPTTVRLPPRGWVKALVSGKLPLEALALTSALHLAEMYDVGAGEEGVDVSGKQSGAALTAWLTGLPERDDLGQVGIDLSMRHVRGKDVETAVVTALFASPLCRRLRWLNVSRTPFDPHAITEQDIRDAEHRLNRFLRFSWPLVTRAPFAETLQHLVAEGLSIELDGGPAAAVEVGRLPHLDSLVIGDPRNGQRTARTLRALAEARAFPSLQRLDIEEDLTAQVARALRENPATKRNAIQSLTVGWSAPEMKHVHAIARACPSLQEVGLGGGLGRRTGTKGVRLVRRSVDRAAFEIPR